MIFNTLLSGGIDTSDATATASQIFNGQTAYVNGEKITGTALATTTTAAASNIEKGKTAYNNNGQLITGRKFILSPTESKTFTLTNPSWSFSFYNGGSDYSGYYQSGAVFSTTEIKNYVKNKIFMVKPMSIRLEKFQYNGSFTTENVYLFATSDSSPTSSMEAHIEGQLSSTNELYFWVTLHKDSKLRYNPSDSTYHTVITSLPVTIYLFDMTVYNDL